MTNQPLIEVFEHDEEVWCGSVSCSCGYWAYGIKSAGWDGPVPFPTWCSECGQRLVRVPPSGKEGASGR